MEAAKPTAPAAGTEEFLPWTNVQGKVIEAKFAGLQGDAVKIVMRDGRSFTVPLASLKPESAAQAKKLGGCDIGHKKAQKTQNRGNPFRANWSTDGIGHKKTQKTQKSGKPFRRELVH